ncbi:GspE/PulE family protein [Synechocystis sp. LKSZ1]|uniref:GspE/PulE family protein n=1 Tax=Synechocystis sp. LKSZ1 TaxID=3144951 RepID=UPI00336C0BD9
MSFAADPSDLGLSPFGRELIQAGYLSLSQLQQATREARQSGRPLPIVVEGMIGESLPQELVRQYRQQHRFTLKVLYGVNFFDLDRDPIDLMVVTKLIDRYLPWSVCQQHQLMPLGLHQMQPSRLMVLMVNPEHTAALAQLETYLNPKAMTYQRLGITVEDYQALLAQYLEHHSPGHSPGLQNATVVDITEIMEDIPSPMPSPSKVAAEELNRPAPEKENPITALVNKILILGLREKATEIHLDPQETKLTVQIRQGGSLRPLVEPLPKDMIPAVIKRLKAMAGLDVEQTQFPQKARLKKSYSGRPVYFFIHTLPSFYGEKILVRVVESLPQLPDFSDLSADPYDQEHFKAIVTQTAGLVLITGPAHGGKSTTMEAFLGQYLKRNLRVGTVEDPIRRAFPGITQVEVDTQRPFTYGDALQSLAEQSMDVIGIDLVEDAEVAQAAFTATQQGRLVFACVNAKDSATAITQGQAWLSPHLLAESLVAIVHQKLLRQVCPTCRLVHHPEAQELQQLGLGPAQLQGSQFYRANSLSPDIIQQLHLKGRLCRQCSGVGYHGQVAIYEFIPLTPALRQAIAQTTSPEALRPLLQQAASTPLPQRALAQVLRGNTTLEELLRVFPNALTTLGTNQPAVTLPPDFEEKLKLIEDKLAQLTQAVSSLKQSLHPALPSASAQPSVPSTTADLDLMPELLALENLAQGAVEDEVDLSQATLIGQPPDWEDLAHIDPKAATIVAGEEATAEIDPNATVINPFKSIMDPWKE